jgi:lysophospholipase L1-like esterase
LPLVAAALIIAVSACAAHGHERVAQAATPNVITPTTPTPEGAGPPPSPVVAVEDRIAGLHEEIGITPQEEPRFDAFAAVMRANAQLMTTLFQQRARAANANVTAVDGMRWYARFATANADAMQKLVPVFETLYQSLSDAQKKAADTAFEDLQIKHDPNRSE